MTIAVDLFGGPGGWDLAARVLGVDPVGVEWDDAACATRRAAGLRTVQGDVSALDPVAFMLDAFGASVALDLLIASAPCQAFSMAGSGEGRRALEFYVRAIARMLEGEQIPRDELDEQCGDPRAHLVLEPLRWALALRPRMVALEQVEPVLPLWEAMGAALRQLGYGVWVGVLSAERFGVPQTRKRAFLLASVDGRPCEPPASHARYVPPRVKPAQDESLFAAPEPERIVLPEDRGLLPWVSMAEALGWGMNARPSVTVASGGEDRRGAKPLGGGTGSQRTIDRERDGGAWLPGDRVGFPRRNDLERDFRDASEPAFTLTEKARSAVRLRATNQPNAAVRGVDEPAPTIAAGHSTADRVWESGEPSHLNTGRDWKPGGTREDAQKIPTSEPSPAVTAKLGGQAQWVVQTGANSMVTSRENEDLLPYERPVDAPAPTVDRKVGGAWRVVEQGERERFEDRPRASEAWPEERPATTVAGDPRVFPPGHKLNEDDIAAGRDAQRRSGAGMANGSDGGTAVRVTEQEAAVLQSFPADYPWQGTRTAKYRQIGDAVPPLLALAVLRALIGGVS